MDDGQFFDELVRQLELLRDRVDKQIELLSQKIESNQLKTETMLLENWKAASIAIRTLADWWARDADRNNKDRDERQKVLDAQFASIQGRQDRAEHDRRRLEIMIYVLAGMILVVIALVVGARWL